MPSFLPPTSENLFPKYHPDKGHLRELEENPFLLEFLSRVHRRLFQHRERLSSEKNIESFDRRMGRIEGIAEVCQELETLKCEVENK